MSIFENQTDFNFDVEKDSYRIGSRIKKIRMNKGLSQAELGAAVGLTADRIQKYENGVRKPKNDLLFKFSEVLEVSPWALLDPNTMSRYGAMYALFEIADMFDMKIEKTPEGLPIGMCLSVDNMNPLFEYMKAWYEEHTRIQTELEVATTDEERKVIEQSYNDWKWNFPKTLVDKTAKNLQKERIKDKIEKLQEEYDKLNNN